MHLKLSKYLQEFLLLLYHFSNMNPLDRASRKRDLYRLELCLL